MTKGQDNIDLVPHDVTPRYCNDYFPEEDTIIDFKNPWTIDPEDYKKIAPFVYYYLLDKLLPAYKFRRSQA